MPNVISGQEYVRQSGTITASAFRPAAEVAPRGRAWSSASCAPRGRDFFN
jgi:hypothetical protein